jgi:hypothetical protein
VDAKSTEGAAALVSTAEEAEGQNQLMLQKQVIIRNRDLGVTNGELISDELCPEYGMLESITEALKNGLPRSTDAWVCMYCR